MLGSRTGNARWRLTAPHPRLPPSDSSEGEGLSHVVCLKAHEHGLALEKTALSSGTQGHRRRGEPHEVP